jgi:hypothetical protein
LGFRSTQKGRDLTVHHDITIFEIELSSATFFKFQCTWRKPLYPI